jgi:hypothetical protein
MIPGYQVLAARIRDELEDLERSVRRAERAWQAAARAGADQDMFIDSAALNLHGFYAGVERLFEAAALQLDGSLPKGEAWHRDLLDQMTLDLPGLRPPVISQAVMQLLEEYRRFRHVVRNVYAESLDPLRVGELVERLAPLWMQLRKELSVFADFLEGVSRADGMSA